MKKFELALVINGNENEEGKEKVLTKVVDLIKNLTGKVEKIDDWGKRRLAYEINKMREGYYYFITFESEELIMKLIDERIRFMEKVLRFLIVRVDE